MLAEGLKIAQTKVDLWGGAVITRKKCEIFKIRYILKKKHHSENVFIKLLLVYIVQRRLSELQLTDVFNYLNSLSLFRFSTKNRCRVQFAEAYPFGSKTNPRRKWKGILGVGVRFIVPSNF